MSVSSGFFSLPLMEIYLFTFLCLFQVERSGPARTRFPDIYHEFESLQAQVRQAAQDYIMSPQAGAVPLEVRNIEVRSSAVFLSVVPQGTV